MALSTIVKVSSVNNLSDARFCAGMGVDLMGFCLDKTNSEFISPTKFKEITGWITGVKTVGEFEEASSAEILECLSNYKLHYLQISNALLLDQLEETQKPVIFKVDLDQIGQLPIHPSIHYYLIERNNEELKEAEFKIIKEHSKLHSILIGFGINQKNVKEILSKTSIKGIELKGGNEIKPGLKDFDELAEILEILEID